MSRKLMNFALMYTAITAYASEYPFGSPSPRFARRVIIRKHKMATQQK